VTVIVVEESSPHRKSVRGSPHGSPSGPNDSSDWAPQGRKSAGRLAKGAPPTSALRQWGILGGRLRPYSNHDSISVATLSPHRQQPHDHAHGEISLPRNTSEITHGSSGLVEHRASLTSVNWMNLPLLNARRRPCHRPICAGVLNVYAALAGVSHCKVSQSRRVELLSRIFFYSCQTQV
jgi:hypothetical protein